MLNLNLKEIIIMNKNDELIKDLKDLVFALSKQVLSRSIQCKIFKNDGFLKLSEKYEGHLKEEREYLDRTIEKIINLGGEFNLDESNIDTKEYAIFKDPVKYLEHEKEISENGLAYLKEIINKAKEEFSTYDFLISYYKDEEEDLSWTESQLNLKSRKNLFDRILF